MRVAVLFSGGKDSTFAAWLALSYGWNVVSMVTMLPKSSSSYMFHHPNVNWTPLQAEAMELPLILKKTPGKKDEELEDLKDVLSDLEIDGVLTGAVASEYQKEKIDLLCEKLKLKSFAPIWHKDSEQLLREMVDSGFEMIITSVSAQGFDESWLGRKIDERCIDDLARLKEKFGINISGEGGEYESLVLHAPFFKSRMKIISSETRWKGTAGSLEVTNAACF
ncbi:MAG: TIGR00289 family protein [Candidatus Micrarchaeota archaeon]|nr:TIGR00289 family protein [Candidatus Micrarchaeota archaeon]